MSFGFPAYHRQRERYRATDLELTRLCVAAMSELGWQAIKTDGHRVTATHGVSLWSWGERIEVNVDSGGLEIVSKCRAFTQCFDWSKNRRNVESFLERMPSPQVHELEAAHAATGAPVATGATPGAELTRPRRP